MRRAVGVIIGLALSALGPAAAAGEPGARPPGATLLLPDAPDAPAPNRLNLPGTPALPDGGGPADAAPPATLPPAWLVPPPSEAERSADRARLDAALEARFAPPPRPVQRFATDIVPLAGGQPWQVLQRRVDDMLGP